MAFCIPRSSQRCTIKSKGAKTMKKNIGFVFLVLLLIAVSSGCGVASTPVPPTDIPSPSPIPPTFTPEPTATATQVPSPTPLPGSVVLPVDTLKKSNPWLPLDKRPDPAPTISTSIYQSRPSIIRWCDKPLPPPLTGKLL